MLSNKKTMILFIILFIILLLFINFISSHDYKIQEVYYINLDISKKRNIDFLDNYNKHSLNVPLHRISGIAPKSGNDGLRKGQLGCALSHIKILDEISKKPKGWYLVCEDDCSGNFKLIEQKVKKVIKTHPFIMHINLYAPKKIITLGASTRMTGYLVTPLGAKIGKKTIEKNLNKYPCDIALAKSFIHIMIAVNFKSVLYPNGSTSTIGYDDV